MRSTTSLATVFLSSAALAAAQYYDYGYDGDALFAREADYYDDLGLYAREADYYNDNGLYAREADFYDDSGLYARAAEAYAQPYGSGYNDAVYARAQAARNDDLGLYSRDVVEDPSEPRLFPRAKQLSCTGNQVICDGPKGTDNYCRCPNDPPPPKSAPPANGGTSGGTTTTSNSVSSNGGQTTSSTSIKVSRRDAILNGGDDHGEYLQTLARRIGPALTCQNPVCDGVKGSDTYCRCPMNAPSKGPMLSNGANVPNAANGGMGGNSNMNSDKNPFGPGFPFNTPGGSGLPGGSGARGGAGNANQGAGGQGQSQFSSSPLIPGRR